MDRGAWWAIVHGVAKSQTQLNDLHSLTVKALGKWLYLLAAHLPDEVSSSVSSQGSCSRSRGLLPIPSPHQSQPCPLLPVHKTRSPHRAFPVVSSSCILKSICSAKLGQICLISTCQQVEECLLSRANCISQPVDLHLLSPAINAYSAARSVPVSRLRSTCHSVDQHLSAS